MINIKRIYDEPSNEDGIRILVDRLWPRGISKEKAKIDFWLKDIAPSNELRKLFHEGTINFNEFKKRYLIELSEYNTAYKASDGSQQGNPLNKIFELLKTGNKNITLVYALKDTLNNNAAILKEFLLNSFRPKHESGA